jgi:tetratricopeptide (TPR) repeat protein
VFIERDVFDDICRTISSRRPLLVTGPSMSGKTRLAAEAVRKVCGSMPVVMADSGAALAGLLDQGARPKGCVVWLDDLERFVPEGLTVRRMERLRDDGNVLVATMRTSEREKYDPDSRIKPLAWDVLALFEECPLDSRLSASELVLVPDSPYADLADAAGSYGLAEYLGGAPLAWARFTRGKTSHPLGWASVSAAADWRRLTTGPIPDTCLKSLAAEYLPEHRRYDEHDRDSELDWASDRVNETVRLLAPAPGASWLVFDYVLDKITQVGATPPQATWDAIGAAALAPNEAIQAGAAAYEAAQFGVAHVLWEAVAKSGHPDLAPSALFNLGVLREEQGDVAGAEQAYQQVIEAGRPNEAPKAMVNLGMLRQEQGDPAGAEQAYQQAIESGHPDQARAR